MSYGYRCSKTGLFEWAPGPGRHRCVFCRQMHEAYQTGATPEAGLPQVIGDRLPKHYDWGIGAWINSKSQRRRLCQQHGLNLNSAAEYFKHKGDSPRPGQSVSYPGKRDNRSSAERHRRQYL